MSERTDHRKRITRALIRHNQRVLHIKTGREGKTELELPDWKVWIKIRDWLDLYEAHLRNERNALYGRVAKPMSSHR